MIQSINEYLNQLKKELAESDSATIQDALSDAEEHLRTALNSAIKSQPNVSEVDALTSIIEKYGPPSDVATDRSALTANPCGVSEHREGINHFTILWCFC
ncbi:hypothetical protein ACFLWF_02100 [Chloroflexota bacterium]